MKYFLQLCIFFLFKNKQAKKNYNILVIVSIKAQEIFKLLSDYGFSVTKDKKCWS